MNVAFRSDSSFEIGTGHIHRCISIAREFKKKKSRVFFFAHEYKGNINNLIQQEFKLLKLPIQKNKNISKKKQIDKDANITIKYIKKLNIDILFLDHYFLNEIWEKKVSKFCKVVLVSDFINRNSFCNYYLNYNILYENNFISKRLLYPNCKKLIGLDYSIIKNFSNIKKKRNKKKITIFLGGSDTKNFTGKIINILSDKLFDNFVKLIVIGVQNKRKNQIINQIKNLKNFQAVLGNKDNLYSFFLNSKLVITSVGMSMYEHLTLGLNSIVIPQNKLQKKVINNLSSINLINFVSDIKYIDKNYIFKKLYQKNLLYKKKIFQNLFDRKGIIRIVNYFLSKNIYKKAKLKNASEIDKFFLFKLVNDPDVIKNSLSNKMITFKEHTEWFNKTKKNKNSKIYIFKSLYHNLGQVRFDKISNDKTFITYSVANEFRGMGIGYKMLKLALKKRIFKTRLYAVVKKNNEVSVKIFKKLGFIYLKNHQKRNFIYYLKNK
tara:strand:- start:3729 stop:5204 length:1476 start_codon:yes stop_codon:yes gene_type:complete